MQREARTFLSDIQQACRRLARFTADKTLEDYLEDELLRSAVERQFEIIGEALNQALREAPEIEKRITEARSIVGFRNVLAHGYSEVEDHTVWGILTDRLPRLLQEVDALLAEE
jgi:uncharacterized protein with HEPN domain